MKHVKVLVAGGGAAGASTAHHLCRVLSSNQVTVIEPSNVHYYQPMWTLVGGGVKSLAASARPMKSILPSKAEWIQDSVRSFRPEKNLVVTKEGQEIEYEYLVVAMGIRNRWDWVQGLKEALDREGSGVCTNYSHLYVEKTYQEMKNFKGGNALFTFPNTPIKCAGAPQKIMYLAEEMFRKKNLERNVKFLSSLPVLFSVKKYADELWKIVEKNEISVCLRQNLTEVKSEANVAVFENLDTQEKFELPYNFLHVTPPMSSPDPIYENKDLTDESGLLHVDKSTLQHTRYPNIFGIGDCINLPAPCKTAAAVSVQTEVVRRNLLSQMSKEPLPASYTGYSSCPLVTSRSTCIMAEFNYFKTPAEPEETFPFDQSKERRLMFQMKSHLMPWLYWNGLIKGYWTGPATWRKMFHLGK